MFLYNLGLQLIGNIRVSIYHGVVVVVSTTMMADYYRHRSNEHYARRFGFVIVRTSGEGF